MSTTQRRCLGRLYSEGGRERVLRSGQAQGGNQHAAAKTELWGLGVRSEGSERLHPGVQRADGMSERFKNLEITDLGVIAIVAGLYFLAAKLGLSLAFLNASVSPVWPPTGVAIALVWWLGYRSAPGVLLGTPIPTYLLTHFSLAPPPRLSLLNT